MQDKNNNTEEEELMQKHYKRLHYALNTDIDCRKSEAEKEAIRKAIIKIAEELKQD